jgi:hypothetical protein
VEMDERFMNVNKEYPNFEQTTASWSRQRRQIGFTSRDLLGIGETCRSAVFRVVSDNFIDSVRPPRRMAFHSFGVDGSQCKKYPCTKLVPMTLAVSAAPTHLPCDKRRILDGAGYPRLRGRSATAHRRRSEAVSVLQHGAARVVPHRTQGSRLCDNFVTGSGRQHLFHDVKLGEQVLLCSITRPLRFNGGGHLTLIASAHRKPRSNEQSGDADGEWFHLHQLVIPPAGYFVTAYAVCRSLTPAMETFIPCAFHVHQHKTKRGHRQTAMSFASSTLS